MFLNFIYALILTGIAGYVALFYLCKNKQLPYYYNPFGIIILILSTPLGGFVSAFACKHLMIVTRGLTTKQLHSIMLFQSESKKNKMKYENFEGLAEHIKIFDLNNISGVTDKIQTQDSKVIEQNNPNTSLPRANKISIKQRFYNLYKFYMLSIPNSLLK